MNGINYWKKRKWLLVFGLAILVIGNLVYWYGSSRPSVEPIPEKLSSQSKIELYHPKKLPARLQFNPEQTVYEQSAIFTRFTSPAGTLFLTQQAKPKDTDLKQIDSQESYAAPIGTVYILKGEPKKIQAIIAASESWLLLSADETVGLKTVKQFITNLEPISDKS